MKSNFPLRSNFLFYKIITFGLDDLQVYSQHSAIPSTHRWGKVVAWTQGWGTNLELSQKTDTKPGRCLLGKSCARIPDAPPDSKSSLKLTCHPHQFFFSHYNWEFSHLGNFLCSVLEFTKRIYIPAVKGGAKRTAPWTRHLSVCRPLWVRGARDQWWTSRYCCCSPAPGDGHGSDVRSHKPRLGHIFIVKISNY